MRVTNRTGAKAGAAADRVVLEEEALQSSLSLDTPDIPAAAPAPAFAPPPEVDDLIAVAAEADDVPCEFITGSAGTGKTTLLKRRCEADPKYGAFCSTTGISAVNLDTITLNSLLGYFDTDSLADRYLSGALEYKLRRIAECYHNLVIDECSMMAAEQLDMIYRATAAINATGARDRYKLGIVLCGDYCQLPAIKAKFAFEADCWSQFARNVVRLKKFWRQTDREFLEALNFARAGCGPEARDAFERCKEVEWGGTLLSTFDGTTIVAKNAQVDRVNWMALQKLKGRKIQVGSERWGKQRGEWKHIPETLTVKEGAYVMILANDAPNFTFCNGDCGHIVDFQDGTFSVKLVRNGNVVWIEKIERFKEERHADEHEVARWGGGYDSRRKRYLLGGITYFPIRLAYSCTVHKTQSLTLDRIQVDIRDAFFSSPGMGYTALSRVRGPKGLRIVGAPDLLAKRLVILPKVLPWV